MRIKNLLSLLLVVVPLLATAAPKSDLWQRWQQHNPTSTLQVDHQTWTGFLQKYLVPHQPEGFHKVRFAVVTAEDHQVLKAYLQQLQKTPDSQ